MKAKRKYGDKKIYVELLKRNKGKIIICPALGGRFKKLFHLKHKQTIVLQTTTIIS
jgi:hypothetical protein